ncbi:MAG: nodulation protein NfeD, partial [Deltaproteobacteria bacterium]|nr:nodulation protein NfeD [Deltaproteobacteria bacterium]
MLFDSPLPCVRRSLGVIISTVACVSLFFIFVVGLVVKAQSRRPATGNEGLVGLEGVAHTPIDTRQGKVFVHGEYWNAVCAGTIEPGDPVRVESVNGMLLTVVGKK